MSVNLVFVLDSVFTAPFQVAMAMLAKIQNPIYPLSGQVGSVLGHDEERVKGGRLKQGKSPKDQGTTRLRDNRTTRLNPVACRQSPVAPRVGATLGRHCSCLWLLDRLIGYTEPQRFIRIHLLQCPAVFRADGSRKRKVWRFQQAPLIGALTTSTQSGRTG